MFMQCLLGIHSINYLSSITPAYFSMFEQNFLRDILTYMCTIVVLGVTAASQRRLMYAGVQPNLLPIECNKTLKLGCLLSAAKRITFSIPTMLLCIITQNDIILLMRLTTISV